MSNVILNKTCFMQPYIYIVGVIGTGMTMAFLPYATTTSGIYSVCAVLKVISAVTNPIVYCLRTEGYRDQCYETFFVITNGAVDFG